MVKKTLVAELITDGAKLLDKLDKRGFPVDAMFWVELPERDYWRLVIASSNVGPHGAKAAYTKIGEILRGMSMAGLDLAEISALDPDSQQFHDLLSVAEHSNQLAVGSSWVIFNEAVVYRWNNASLTADLDCKISEERLGEVWEAERERINRPRLLFSVQGRRVIVRFHPAHGPRLGGLRNIKQAFQGALHRPDAFPSCKVKWLD
jgi:hypothetical protein